ncbi:MAG: winged helix-turn-helix transcriptional regulator [Anaerolineae bacterium]
MEPNKLLIVARTQGLAKRLRAALDSEEYVMRWVPSTSRALELDLEPALAIMEVPPSGGMRSAAWLKRRFDAPLLAIMQPRQRVPEPVDAFLLRPYRIEDLVDLIESTLLTHSLHLVHTHGMSLDTQTRKLQVGSSWHQLRPIACRILAELMARPGKVIPRDELFRLAWETEDGDSTRALDVHIAGLRRQIERDPHNPKMIVTERGIGYRLQPPKG